MEDNENLSSEGFNYFSLKHALDQHDTVLQESGGLPGILNPNQLDCILSMIKNDDYYHYFADKLSYLIYSIIMDHVFCDANKRTSIALGAYFLSINGYDECIDRFMCEMEFIAVMVAEKQILREELTILLTDIMFDIEHKKELSDKILQYKEENSL